MIIIDVDNQQNGLDIDTELIITWARKAIAHLGYEEAELSVVLVDNAAIQELNRDYLDRDRPTNVISFPQQEGFGPQSHHLGDIVISVERALEEAQDTEFTGIERLQQLLVHGICHLTGYNHEDVPEEQAREMEQAEADVLAHLAHE